MIRIDDILDKVHSYNPGADLELIRKAYVFSAKVHEGQTRVSGEPYLIHPLEVASILTDFKLDAPVVATGLLHDTVEDTHTSLEKIEEMFGSEVSVLVDGLTKLSRFTFEKKEDREAENFRKMILAMAKDMRVVLIKLADRLHNMRTLNALPQEKRRKIASETLDIYAPLANRLGIGWLKTELEDLSFRYLEPEEYDRLEKLVATGREKREQYMGVVTGAIEKMLGEYGLKGKVLGRVKHIYGIHQKMKERELDFENVHDILAFRVIVDSLRDCYSVLGIIHSLWKPVPGRFKDYIAMPKPNMYQSLHTTVVGPFGERMEVQIRTDEMHRHAEYGVAAHWKYKEGKPVMDDKHDMTLAWVRQLLEWQRDVKDSSEFLDTLKIDFFPEEVFVFTPQGDIKVFPNGSTPVDFAYSIHTDVGHKCTGAKINGRFVSIREKLRNGDIVEINTTQGHTPNEDWLKFVVSSRAKAKIRQWIKNEERKKSIELGREICEKGLRKFGLELSGLIKSGDMDRAASELGLTGLEHLLMNVGYGKLQIKQLVTKISATAKELVDKKKGSAWDFINVFERFKPAKKPAKSSEGVVINGLEDLMVRFAKCCNPLPGDQILGFITHGHGVTVHASACPNLLDVDRERLIEAVWAKDITTVRPVKLEVACKNEKGILADMCNAIKESDANIVALDISTTQDNRATCFFEVEVKDTKHLKTIIRAIQRVKSVLNVKRVFEGTDLPPTKLSGST